MNNQKLNNFFKDPRTNWKYIFIVVILAVIVGGGILWYVTQQEFPLTQLSEIKIPKKEGIEEDFEAVLAKEKLLLISGSFEEEYKAIVFNIKTNQIESKGEINSTGITINCWAGCNETIQTDQDGKVIVFYVGDDPQKSEYESPYFVSKLYLSPNKLIFETDETKGIIFGQWVLTKDGQKIYVAVPREDKSTMDLYQISLPLGNTKEIAKDVGKLDAPLRLDVSQKNLLSFFEEERIENNFHYYYIYATKINLESGLVQKELVIKQNPESFPFFEVEGWVISPDLSRVVDLDYISTRDGFWVRVIDLNTHEDNKIFKVSVWSNTDFIWSPDSASLIFALYPSEIYFPSQQGIWFYDFRTQKARILVEKPGSSGVWDRPAQPIEGSFDGQRFLYRTEDGKLHLFNISNDEDRILPIVDLPILAQWIE